jgi:hypothetical protein
VKALFCLYVALAAGTAYLGRACSPAHEDSACHDYLIALVVISMPWSLMLQYVASVLLGLLYLPAILLHLNWRINLGGSQAAWVVEVMVFGSLWAGVLANAVILCWLAFLGGEAQAQMAEDPATGRSSSDDHGDARGNSC